MNRKIVVLLLSSLGVSAMVLIGSSGWISIGDPAPIENNGRSAVIPIEWQKSGVLLIAASVNGTQGKFLVDTGSDRTTLDVNFARKMGLATTKRSWINRFLSLFFKGNAEGELKWANIATLRMGDAEFEKLMVGVYDFRHSNAGMDRPIDGVIGLDIWRVSGLRIDPGKRELAVFPPVPSSKNVQTARFGFKRPGVFKLTMMEAMVEINGEIFCMCIDTGAAWTFLCPRDWTRLKALTSRKVERQEARICDMNQSEVAQMEVLPGNRIKLGGFTKSDLRIRPYEVKNYKNLNILGMDVIGAQVVTILPHLRRIYFE